MAEQRQFVDELCSICETEAIDLVLVAGDVFQTVNPGAQAEELFFSALSALSAKGTRGVVVIAGNHDHPERIKAAQPMADRLGITLFGYPKDTLYPVWIDDDHVARVDAGIGWAELALPGCKDRALVAAVPYPSEARLNEVFSDALDEREYQHLYNAKLKEWLAELSSHFRADAVNVMISHLYVGGGIETDSEIQIQIGGAYAVDKDVFPASAQYVALGHLHRPQEVRSASPCIRYAGSPLAYSFSEAGQQKSVLVVEVEPGQAAVCREIPLSSGRPLVRWEATEGIAQALEWIAAGRDKEAWIDLAVHVTTGLQLEEIHRLRDLHPGIVHIRPVVLAAKIVEDRAQQEMAGLSLAELFARFFEEKLGVKPDGELVDLFLELCTGLGDDLDFAEAGFSEDGEVGV